MHRSPTLAALHVVMPGSHDPLDRGPAEGGPALGEEFDASLLLRREIDPPAEELVPQTAQVRESPGAPGPAQAAA